METILAMYQRMEDAKAAHDELARQHIGNPDIVGPENRPRHLSTFGIPRDEEGTYLDAIRNGLFMVVTQLSAERLPEARQVLRRHHPVDLTGEERSLDRTRPLEGSSTRTDRDLETSGVGRKSSQTIPVVEEEVQIGKRDIERGGVRVTSHVTERPIEEKVQLRDEHVDVERRRVDRPATDRDFREHAIEAREHHEEPVISKQARIVEEVVITRGEDVRSETIRDTVRRTDVDIERLGLHEDFRAHHGQLGRRPEDYESNLPAYRFGSHLASHPDFVGRSWAQSEVDARRHFETRNPGRWEEMKDAVRHGFERMRAKRG